MKLLVVNANTSASVTDLLLASARRFAAPGTEIEAVTAAFGGRYIASRPEIAIAAHATLVAIAQGWRRADGIIVGCFGDPGMDAARDLVPIPVVGMAEAAMAAAALRGERFSILTGGRVWGPLLTDLAHRLGHGRRLAAVHTTDKAAGDYTDRAAALADLSALAMRCVEADGSDVLILGGAGFAALTDDLAALLPVPLVDPMAASIALTELLVRQPGGRRVIGHGRSVAGVDPDLTALLA